MYRIIFVTIFVLLIGCSDFVKKELENEINFLKTQVEQREKELKEYKSIKAKIEKLQKATKTVSASSLQVLNKLEKLDEDFYGGKYFSNLHFKSPKPKTEDIVKGYIELIERIEVELEKKTKI
jgi:hypothetical protein